MDWESKFSSIVRETENNLAKVKQRLGSARSSALSSLSPSTSGIYSTNFSSPSTKRVSFADTSHFDGIASSRTPAEKYSSIDNSTSIPLLLQERLSQQERVIEELKRNVSNLQNDKDRSQKELKELRAELTQVHNRVTERGVDVHTERKIEQWRRELMVEMHTIQSQVSSHRTAEDDHHYNTGQLQSALREIQDVKRFVQDECQSVRRDVDSLKTRIVKVELDLSSIRTDCSDLNRRHDKVDRNVRELSESQKDYSRDITRTLDDRGHDKMQMTELRNTIFSLRDKLSGMESQLYVSSVNKENESDSNRKGKKSKLRKSQGKSGGGGDLFSDSSGLSSLSLADLSSDDFSFHTKPAQNGWKDRSLNLDDLDLSDVPSLSESELVL